jgi:hypothetical protein
MKLFDSSEPVSSVFDRKASNYPSDSAQDVISANGAKPDVENTSVKTDASDARFVKACPQEMTHYSVTAGPRPVFGS